VVKKEAVKEKIAKSVEKAEDKKKAATEPLCIAPLPPVIIHANPGWPGLGPTGGAALLARIAPPALVQTAATSLAQNCAPVVVVP